MTPFPTPKSSPSLIPSVFSPNRECSSKVDIAFTVKICEAGVFGAYYMGGNEKHLICLAFLRYPMRARLCTDRSDLLYSVSSYFTIDVRRVRFIFVYEPQRKHYIHLPFTVCDVCVFCVRAAFEISHYYTNLLFTLCDARVVCGPVAEKYLPLLFFLRKCHSRPLFHP